MRTALTLSRTASCRAPRQWHVGLLVSVFGGAVGKFAGLLPLDHVRGNGRRSPARATRTRRGNRSIQDLSRWWISNDSRWSWVPVGDGRWPGQAVTPTRGQLESSSRLRKEGPSARRWIHSPLQYHSRTTDTRMAGGHAEMCWDVWKLVDGRTLIRVAGSQESKAAGPAATPGGQHTRGPNDNANGTLVEGVQERMRTASSWLHTMGVRKRLAARGLSHLEGLEIAARPSYDLLAAGGTTIRMADAGEEIGQGAELREGGDVRRDGRLMGEENRRGSTPSELQARESCRATQTSQTTSPSSNAGRRAKGTKTTALGVGRRRVCPSTRRGREREDGGRRRRRMVMGAEEEVVEQVEEEEEERGTTRTESLKSRV